MMLIALFPAVNGYFFIPNYPTVVAAINFDRTGTTRIGKYILNHSFMMPGIVSTAVAIALGLLFIQFFLSIFTFNLFFNSNKLSYEKIRKTQHGSRYATAFRHNGFRSAEA